MISLILLNLSDRKSIIFVVGKSLGKQVLKHVILIEYFADDAEIF